MSTRSVTREDKARLGRQGMDNNNDEPKLLIIAVVKNNKLHWQRIYYSGARRRATADPVDRRTTHSLTDAALLFPRLVPGGAPAVPGGEIPAPVSLA